METFLIKAAQLMLAFAILVIIHEFGHFLFARMFGVRVEKFYMFFDPWFEIFKWRPKKYYGFMGKTTKRGEISTDSEEAVSPDDAAIKEEEEAKKEGRLRRFWGHTEYGVGWIPLGGYCKISGMIDESMDSDQMKREPQPWEFRTKPAWQRLLIMVAGVLFNFLLAILIYAGIVFCCGEKYVPFKEAKMGMAFSPAAKEIGFRDGDIPVAADGKPLDNPAEARIEMIQASKVDVIRDGKTVSVAIPEKFIFDLDDEVKSGKSSINFMQYRIPTRITQVSPGEGAAKGGVKVGDQVIAIDSTATPSLDVFLSTLPGHENKVVDLTILRDEKGRTDTIHAKVPLNDGSKMGVGLEVNPAAFFNAETKSYNLFQSVPRGIEMGVDKLTSYADSMKLVFTKEGAKSVGGFGSIGSLFPEKWDWLAFWNIAAFLSVALAFMNILPIPALDGGHIMFLLYEVITGRKPSDKFQEWATGIGMGLLILLLLYANGMDIVRLFSK